MTLAAVTERFRKRLTEYRYKNRMDTRIQPPILFMEIALNLTEMAISKGRAISQAEEYWFDNGWDLIHELEKTEWDDMVDLYRELGYKVKERDWFR